MSVRHRIMSTAMTATAVVLLLPAAPAAAATQPSYESRLLSLVNGARTSRGLRALQMTAGTRTVARGWSAHMAATGVMAHNPNLGAALRTHGSPHWGAIAENVAKGTSSPDRIFSMLMGSAPHRANILGSRYRFVGIGTVTGRGWWWTTMDFVDSYSGGSAAPAPPRAKPKPRTVHRHASRPTQHRRAVTKPRASRARHSTHQPALVRRDPLRWLDAMARDKRLTIGGSPAPGGAVHAAPAELSGAKKAANSGSGRPGALVWVVVPVLVLMCLAGLQPLRR